MHPTLYQAVSTAVTVLALGTGVVAQHLEVDRPRPTPRAAEASTRRWDPPQGLAGHPATSAEAFLTVE